MTVAMVCVLLFVGTLLARSNAAAGSEFAEGAPDPQEVVDLVDVYWPHSRVLLMDLRSAAIYADSIPNRFSPRIDVVESDIQRQIEEEHEGELRKVTGSIVDLETEKNKNSIEYITNI